MNTPDITTIYNDYHDKVMGYIYTRLRSREDAEDLCQEVFIKISTKIETFDPEKASVSTWVFSITRNTVIDFYRRKRPTSELDENIAEDGEIDDDLLNDESLEELADALMKLPEQLRAVIVYRYYDGLPLTEVAKKMGLSYGAVKLRHAAALHELEQRLDRGD